MFKYTVLQTVTLNDLLVGSIDCLGLYSQVIKCMWWMPWQSEAMKDVIACDKLRGGGKYPVIRRFLNGETHLS